MTSTRSILADVLLHTWFVEPAILSVFVLETSEFRCALGFDYRVDEFPIARLRAACEKLGVTKVSSVTAGLLGGDGQFTPLEVGAPLGTLDSIIVAEYDILSGSVVDSLCVLDHGTRGARVTAFASLDEANAVGLNSAVLRAFRTSNLEPPLGPTLQRQVDDYLDAARSRIAEPQPGRLPDLTYGVLSFANIPCVPNLSFRNGDSYLTVTWPSLELAVSIRVGSTALEDRLVACERITSDG